MRLPPTARNVFVLPFIRWNKMWCANFYENFENQITDILSHENLVFYNFNQQHIEN